jgi:hypothetical protein
MLIRSFWAGAIVLALVFAGISGCSKDTPKAKDDPNAQSVKPISGDGVDGKAKAGAQNKAQ